MLTSFSVWIPVRRGSRRKRMGKVEGNGEGEDEEEGRVKWQR